VEKKIQQISTFNDIVGNCNLLFIDVGQYIQALISTAFKGKAMV
jgi:hypothetical protein